MLCLVFFAERARHLLFEKSNDYTECKVSKKGDRGMGYRGSPKASEGVHEN